MATKTIKNPDGTYTTYDDASYTPPVAAPSPISVGSLSSTETPAALPDQPQTPDYLSSITSIPGMAELTGAAPTATETKQNDLSSRLEQAYAKLGGQGAAQQSAEQAAGLPGFQTQLTDINNQIQTLQKEAAMIPIALQQDAVGRGVTAGGLAPIQADQLRTNAIKSLSLSAIAQTIQGNVALAQQQADKAVEAEFGGVQAEIDFLSQALQLNTQALSREDEKKAQSLSIQLQERQRQLDDAKENRNIIIGWAAEASKNGASSYLINQALATKDPSQALQLLGGFFQDPNAKAQALAELEYTRAQTKIAEANASKILSEVTPGGGSKPVATGPYADALNTILGSGKFTKDQEAAVTRAINQGEDPFIVIKNQAKNIMGQAGETKITSYETARQTLADVEASLIEYYAAGGKTSFLTGNYEKVINKLGEVKDPELVSIATQIAASLQIYRNAVSGTAYSVQEGNDIAAIFPGINKTEGLNTAILDGRKKAFDSTIDASYRAVLGSSYDKLKTSQSNASGTTLLIGPDGQQYNVPNAQVDAFLLDGGKRPGGAASPDFNAIRASTTLR